ncbi:hypothetical protein K438DRAFT_1600534 [Mycena galopus ATCC 62051]|nr:hypothetical protein K438DRAFT_1600534 [Mycena galopus ATCC 62051]
MRSFTNINSFALAAVAFTTLCKVNADIITYTGDECAGQPSVDYSCNGVCQSFASQKSFEIDVDGNHCVTIFQDAACQSPVTSFGNPPAAKDICIEVSTGTPQLSFKCVANTNCNN